MSEAGAKLRGVVGLDGPSMTWIEYPIRGHHCVMGRKSKSNEGIDVCLGEDKSVSREHLKISWNKAKRIYELFVIGKNGVRVNGQALKPEARVPLENQTRLQLADSILYFLMPVGSESKAKLVGSDREKAAREQGKVLPVAKPAKRPAPPPAASPKKSWAAPPAKKKKKKSPFAIAQEALAEKHRREYDVVLFKVLNEKKQMRFSELCDHIISSASHLIGDNDTTTWRGRLSQRLSTSDKYVKIPDLTNSKLNYWKVSPNAKLDPINDPELEELIRKGMGANAEDESFKVDPAKAMMGDDSDDDDEDEDGGAHAGADSDDNGMVAVDDDDDDDDDGGAVRIPAAAAHDDNVPLRMDDDDSSD